MKKKELAFFLCLITITACSNANIRQIRALSQGVPKQVIGAAQLFCDGEPQPAPDSEYYVLAIANRTAAARERGRNFPMKVCKQMKYRESVNYDQVPSAGSHPPFTRTTYKFDVIGLHGGVCGELSLVWEQNQQKVIAFNAVGHNGGYAYGNGKAFYIDERNPWTARVGDVW